jgi:hypothetical protein
MSIREQLDRARAKDQIVRVYREGLEDGWVDGHVAGLGPEFFAIELVDKGIRLDGYTCMRYADVTECLAPGPRADFLRKALAARKMEYGRALAVDFSSLSSLVRTAGTIFPLLSIFIEGDDDDVCYIGKVVSVSDLHIRLLEISPGAEWGPAPTAWQLKAITRVDFGGSYEDALFLVGGRS